MKKLKILFLCTGNSCRSQIAEGWARHLKNGVIEAYSAGIKPIGLNPDAVLVMKEAGVDITGQTSKHLDDIGAIELDYVVTVCGHANETCPVFRGKTRVVHVGFDDPPAGVVQRDGDGRGLEQRAKPFLAVAQSVLRGDALEHAASVIGQGLKIQQVRPHVGIGGVALGGENADEFFTFAQRNVHARGALLRLHAERAQLDFELIA